MKLQFAEMSTGGMQAGEQHLQWILCVDSVKNVTTSLHVVKLMLWRAFIVTDFTLQGILYLYETIRRPSTNQL